MSKQQYRENTRIKPIGHDGINQCREILKNHQYAKVNEVMVDGFSASAIVQVFDALNAENQAKLVKLPVAKVAKICFSVLH